MAARTTNRGVALFLVTAVVSTAACNNGPLSTAPPVPVVEVRGKVLYRNQPVTKAKLRFYPTSGDPNAVRPWADTDEKGEFEVYAFGTNKGAPEGEYAVTIFWPAPPKSGGRPKPADADDDAPESGGDVFRGKFAIPKTTPLKVTIQAGVAELPTINVPAQ